MYDVIIIGAGSVGLTMANLLAGLGLKLCVIEKKSQINLVSNAVGVNDECLLAWKMCGVLEQTSPYIAYNDKGSVILKYLDEQKSEIFSLRQSLGVAGFAKGVVFLQNKIDEILLQNLEQKAEVNFNEELIEISQNQDFVTLKTNKKEYHAKYLIAADGKESACRKLLGISFKKFSSSKDEWLILNLFTKNFVPKKHFVEVFCGARSVVLCPLPENNFRVEFSLKKGEEEILHDEKKIREIVSNYFDFTDYKILNKARHRFSVGIAQTYYKNRVVLCGDAAHCTSPFASAGLVSGIRDCLVLRDIFQNAEIDFSLYSQRRYQKQKSSLRLAILLEQLMRPNPLFKNSLFFLLKFLAKSSAFIKLISIRA